MPILICFCGTYTGCITFFCNTNTHLPSPVNLHNDNPLFCLFETFLFCRLINILYVACSYLLICMCTSDTQAEKGESETEGVF